MKLAQLRNADFSLSQTALGAGGILYGIGEYSIYNKNFGYWLGKNGKYYTNMTGRGPNQWTGSRGGAAKTASYWRNAGRATFWIGAGFSTVDIINNVQARNYGAAAYSGLDIGMGALGAYGGPYGVAISSIYFLGKWATDNGYISPSEYKPNWQNVCFKAGTLILMGDKTYKKIEAIKKEDIVYSFDFSQNKIVKASVKALLTAKAESIYTIHLNNGKAISVTAEHPFYIEGYGWKSVKQLSRGDRLKSFSNEMIEIVTIKISNESVEVYNFEVNNTHNYYVTDSSILVHNKNIEN